MNFTTPTSRNCIIHLSEIETKLATNRNFLYLSLYVMFDHRIEVLCTILHFLPRIAAAFVVGVAVISQEMHPHDETHSSLSVQYINSIMGKCHNGTRRDASSDNPFDDQLYTYRARNLKVCVHLHDGGKRLRRKTALTSDSSREWKAVPASRMVCCDVIKYKYNRAIPN